MLAVDDGSASTSGETVANCWLTPTLGGLLSIEQPILLQLGTVGARGVDRRGPPPTISDTDRPERRGEETGRGEGRRQGEERGGDRGRREGKGGGREGKGEKMERERVEGGREGGKLLSNSSGLLVNSLIC